VEEAGVRLIHVLSLSGRAPEQWDEAFQRQLSTMLGGTVKLYQAESPRGRNDPATLSFVQSLPANPGWWAEVQFAAPALLRAQLLQQRTLAVIVVLALLVITVPVLLALIGARGTNLPPGATRTPWAATRAQATGMAHFAKISHERTTALAQEQDARVRAEQDLQVNRTLLGHSVDSRIRLGRELHDNICQTLYAVCLTLESVQKKNSLVPELKQRVDQCMTELRRLNQEVRAYLQDLEPAQVNGQNFASAVEGMLAPFLIEGGVRIEHRLDEAAVAHIPSHQSAEIMSILREAVSNGVRHGRARRITIRAGRNEQEVALAVQDDGVGFAPLPHLSGHGLGNMHARAAALGGSLRVESTPGKGTRVLLTLPVVSAA